MIGILLLVAGVLTDVATAFVLMKLWHWHVVPSFHLHDLKWAHAFGLILVLGVLRYKITFEAEHTWQEWARASVVKAIVLAVILFLGWVATQV